MTVRPLYRIRIIGQEHLPAGAFILCANHISFFDPICLGMTVSRPIYFMAKSELFTCHGRLAAAFLRKCGVFPVQRGHADTAAVDTAAALLRRGRIIGIFPQGGIVRRGQPVRTKAGAALLAAKQQVPLLPAVIYTEGRVRPFVRMTVRFGHPLTPDGTSLRSARNLNQRLQNAMQSLWEEGHGN